MATRRGVEQLGLTHIEPQRDMQWSPVTVRLALEPSSHDWGPAFAYETMEAELRHQKEFNPVLCSRRFSF